MKKRIGSIFLTLCLLISMFSSINVHAEENIKNANVNIAVVGMYNEILFKPQQISVNYEGENPTAEDALKATGLTAQIKDNGWIESIENQANGTDDGYYNSQSGWMYKVNFTVPNKLAKEQGIKDEDYVFFYYAKSQSDLLPSYDSTQNDFVNVTVKSTQNDNSFNEQVTVLKNNSVNAAIMEALKKHGSDFDRSSLSSGMLMTGDGHLWSYILNDDKGTYDEQELQLKDGDIITVLKDDGEGIKEDEENSTTTADTEKPVIAAEGLTDGQNVSEAELTFKVTVSDNADKTIVPTVKLNSEVITGTDGTYKVTLIDGDNTITIEAVDAAGNKADATYKIEYTAAPKVSYKTQLDKSLAYILKTVDNPQLGTSGGEWSVLSLARANYTVPGDYYSKYYDNVAQVVKEKSGVLHAKKYTEYSRVILGLTSIGKGVTDVGGYNLLEKLADYDKVIWQGINGPIFALIALDSKNYEIPIVEGISTQTTREKLIENILSKEINKGTENAGGWALSGSTADPDITAMAIQALTPYYNTNSDVKAAVDRGINTLSKLQLTSGGYKSWGSENSESTSQVIVALSELGIDPAKDTRFVKNGNSLIDALLTFAVADGGFKHISSETEPNGMATDQGTYALVAYDRFINGKNSLYNMTDAQGTDTEKPAITVEGLTNGQTVSEPVLIFKATVSDNVDKAIVPTVKLNGNVITATDGTYKVTLIDGENTITVEVTDAAGNKADVTYKIIYKSVPKEVKGYITISVEKFTLGLGYFIEPIRVPFYEGDNGANILTRLLGDGNYKYTGNIASTFYLSKIKDPDTREINVPQYIKDKVAAKKATIGGRKDPAWLGEFDYTNMSGWMYIVNNNMPNVGCSSYTPKDGDVIRWQFTVYGYGLDLGIGWGTPYITVANKDALTAKIGEINSSSDKQVILSNNDVKTAYDDAYKVVENMESTQEDVNEALSQLISTIEAKEEKDTEKPAITVEGLTNGQTVSEPVLTFKATVSDNVDKAIVPTVKLNGNVITATDGTYKVTLIDGENTITVEVTDAAGNKADVTYKIIYKSVPLEITLPDEDNPEIKIPQDSSEAKDCKICIKASDSNKEIKIEIPKEKNSKVILGLPANTELPKIDAVKDNITVQIPKGAKITSGDTSSIELITARDKSSENVVNKLISVIPQDKKLDAIEQYFSMGTSSKTVFSNYVTLTFKNMKGKDAAYIQNGTLYAIQKYSNDLEGQNSGKNEYAYESGNDLIVKTKHFTEFIAYTTSNKDNGGIVTPSKSYVTLSVDKQTINKGYVINPTSVELQPGDTAWTVLKRELDKRSLSCSYEFTEKYGSIYVQSIDGDGEFDHGSGSGWMYNVNGWYPNYGSSKYVLKNGDVLQWRYTTNLGADLGEDLSKWQDPSNPNPSNPGTTNPSNSSTTNPSTGEQIEKTIVIDLPKDVTKDYEVNINDDLKKSDDIIINVPDVKSKVYLNIDKIKDNTPKLTAAKNNISVTIDKGTKIQSQDNKIELITSMDNTDTKVLELIAKGIDKDYEFNKIDSAFVIGSRDKSILFSQPVTLVFKNCKGKVAGFIEGDKFITIKIYESNEKGKAAVKSDEKFSYAYVDGNDLIVKTNHFTTYVTYEQTKIYYKDQSTISKDIKKQVIEATEKEFISPRNGRFDGKVYIARADFAKMLVGIFDIDTKTAKQLEYSDMKPGSRYYSYYPYYTYINAVCNAGLMQCVNNNFRPNMGITREEAAAAIAKGLAIKNVTVNAKISDLKNVSKCYKTDVETLCTLGLIPLENNQFKPKSYVTREFAVVSCMRTYEYKNGKIFAKADVKKYIDETAALMQKNTPNPVVASVGGEWTVLSLARSGVLVPESFYSKYLTNLENTLKEKKGKLHNVKYTEYDRVILALTSMGKKVDDVASYNLLIPLADFNTLIKQGLNGPIWALIALDTCNFKIPEDKSVALQTTREKLIDYILERELPGGGWSLTSKAPADTDITAMTLTALSRYQGNTKVKAATDRALAFLSRTQEKDGKYKSTWGDETSSESLAQVIVALTSLNIDPLTDNRFIKNGNDTIKALLTFYVKDGGFKHVLSGSLDAMATDQGMYALIAYSRFANGQGKLFDMTDAEKK